MNYVSDKHALIMDSSDHEQALTRSAFSVQTITQHDSVVYE